MHWRVAFQPADTSDNFEKLTAKIAAHEVGHLLGMEHTDAVGPIGYGTHVPLYPSQGSSDVRRRTRGF